jgi:hypothetical protein
MTTARGAKRQRELARKEREERKRVRKDERREAASAAGDDQPAVDQAAVLNELAELHRRFADDLIDIDEFELRKAELTASLRID